jgi:hypothetical protein
MAMARIVFRSITGTKPVAAPVTSRTPAASVTTGAKRVGNIVFRTPQSAGGLTSTERANRSAVSSMWTAALNDKFFQAGLTNRTATRSAEAPEIAGTKMTALSSTSVRTPKFGEVPLAKLTDWLLSPTPAAPKNSRGEACLLVSSAPTERAAATWETKTNILGQKYYLAPWNDPEVKNDAIAKMYYSTAGTLTQLAIFLGAMIVSAIRPQRADTRTTEQKLGQQAEQSLAESQPIVDIRATTQAAAESQRNANRALGYISENVRSAVQQFSDEEIRGLVTRAGWNMTEGEISNMISGLRASAVSPKGASISTDAITSFVSSTLKESGTKIGGMTQLLLAIGDALPNPPSSLANILAPILMTRPTQETANGVEKDATAFFQTLRSEISSGSWKRLAVPVGEATTKIATISQPSTPAKPVTTLAEIPRAVPVGQPQTVSEVARPRPVIRSLTPTVRPVAAQPAPLGESLAVVRTGSISPGGVYVALTGTPYAESPKGKQYILLPDTKVADTREPAVVKALITETLRAPDLTPDQQTMLQEASRAERIDYLVLDETPMAAAAKTVGYDAVRIAESQDLPGEASGIFVMRVGQIHAVQPGMSQAPVTPQKAPNVEIPQAQVSPTTTRAPTAPQMTQNAPITNTAPLPAGQTTVGGEELPIYGTTNEPNLAAQGTSETIPASQDDIARITVAFDDVVKAKRAGKLTKATEGTYQKAFENALQAAGVPKGALNWKDAIQYYKQSRGQPSLESRLAKVAKAVEKYNNKVLAEKMAGGREKVQSSREVAEKLRKARQESRERMEASGKKLMEKAKKASENQKIVSEIDLAKQKSAHDLIVSALKQRARDMLKTQEWLTAATNRRIKDADERRVILDHIKSLKLTRLPSEIAERIAEVTKGVKGMEKVFEQPSDTEFTYVLQKKGIEVKERQAEPAMTELDLPAMRELWDHVKGLVKIGVDQKIAIKMAQKSLENTTVDDCVASMLADTTPVQIPEVGGEMQPLYKGDKTQEALATIDNIFSRKQWLWQGLEEFKGKADERGPLTQALYDDPIAMEADRLRTRNKLVEQYDAELKKSSITEKTYNTERTLPSGLVITQAQAMFISINAMSEQNLYHLRLGHNLTSESIKQAIESLTPKEAAFVDYMAQTERGSWARVNLTYELTHGGQSLPKIDNYVHMDIEKANPLDTRNFSDQTIEEMMARGFAKDSMTQGFTKERVARSPRRLREDPVTSFITYMMDSTDYIFRAPLVKTLSGVINDKVFAEAYTLKAGIKGYKSLQKYVEHVGNPSAALGLYGSEHMVDRFFRNTRGNGAVAVLSLRLSRFFTAGASYSTSINQFGIKAMAEGTAMIVAHPRETMIVIKNLMPIVYDRLVNPVRIEAEIATLQKTWTDETERVRSAMSLLFRLADAADIQSAATGGLAEYQALHPDWSIEKCAYEVQREIIATHSTDLIETKPDIYLQGELARNITMFTSEQTAVSNYLAYLGRGAAKGKIPKASFLKAIFWAVVVLSQIMRLADYISSGGKDEDKWWSTWWGAVVMSSIETIPVFGNMITGSIKGRAFSLPIGLKFLETGTRALMYVIKGDWANAFKWGATTAGYMLGLPVAALTELDRWFAPGGSGTTGVSPTVKPTKPTKPPSTKPTKP